MPVEAVGEVEDQRRDDHDGDDEQGCAHAVPGLVDEPSPRSGPARIADAISP